MEPLIKWPGGKAGEIPYIQGMIPDFDRYVEPFFGGGALFFHLRPRRAVINDVSEDLITFYRLVQAQDRRFTGRWTPTACCGRRCWTPAAGRAVRCCPCMPPCGTGRFRRRLWRPGWTPLPPV